MKPNKAPTPHKDLKAQEASIKESLTLLGDKQPKELYLDVKVDHFVYNSNVSSTYPMRYLVDDTNYNKENGTILFYAGNEGGVWSFYNNSGFVTNTLAKEL